jgi:head-tail adaptor
MRAQPDLTTKHRLRWQGGVLNIQSIVLRGARLEEQEILCAEQVD